MVRARLRVRFRELLQLARNQAMGGKVNDALLIELRLFHRFFRRIQSKLEVSLADLQTLSDCLNFDASSGQLQQSFGRWLHPQPAGRSTAGPSISGLA